MRILDNPILGKNFAQSGLSLKPDGLYRKVRMGDFIHQFIITDDVEKIVELIDIKFEDIDKIFGIEAYNVILKSNYFNPFIFMGDDDTSPLIMDFKEYLFGGKVFVPMTPRNLVRTTRIESVLGISLRDKIDNVRNILSQFNTIKSKYNGNTLLPHLGDYSPTNFSTSFPKFKESFEDEYSFKEFLVVNSIEDIAKHFKTINNIV